MNRPGPRHGPGLRRANQNRWGVAHSGQFAGEKIEIYTLSPAIGISSVGKKADLHFFRVKNAFLSGGYLVPGFGFSSYRKFQKSFTAEHTKNVPLRAGSNHAKDKIQKSQIFLGPFLFNSSLRPPVARRVESPTGHGRALGG